MKTENGQIKAFCWNKHLRKRLGMRRLCSRLRRRAGKKEINAQLNGR